MVFLTGNSTNVANLTGNGTLYMYRCLYEFVPWFHYPMLILGVATIAVNLFIFVFIQHSRHLRRSASNFILVGLSLNDTFTGINAFIHIIPAFYFHLKPPCGYHLFEKLDNAYYLVGKICLLGSIGHLLLLAGERMIVLFLPLHFKTMMVRKRVLPAIFCVWAVSICIPLIELIYRYSDNMLKYRQIQVITTTLIFWVFPTFLLCVQYIAMLCLIYKFQRKHSFDIKSLFSKHKALLTYLAMFASFFILVSPHFALRIILAFTMQFPTISWDVLRIFILLRHLPALFDPLIYAVFKEDFQRAFSKTFRRSKNLETEGWSLSRWTISRKSFQSAQKSLFRPTTESSCSPTTDCTMDVWENNCMVSKNIPTSRSERKI